MRRMVDLETVITYEGTEHPRAHRRQRTDRHQGVFLVVRAALLSYGSRRYPALDEAGAALVETPRLLPRIFVSGIDH